MMLAPSFSVTVAEISKRSIESLGIFPLPLTNSLWLIDVLSVLQKIHFFEKGILLVSFSLNLPFASFISIF